MDYFVKQLPDNTVTLLTREGHIIGKFDSEEETRDIVLDLQPASNARATLAREIAFDHYKQPA